MRKELVTPVCRGVGLALLRPALGVPGDWRHVAFFMVGSVLILGTLKAWDA